MTRATLSLLAPPLAVARYGCASHCAAPIGVFWIAGIASLVYGGLGGPLRSGSVAWTVVGLGVVLLITACAWALLTVQGVSDDHLKERRTRRNTRGIVPQPPADTDESDPLEEVRRSREET
ncbi:hypothetical protein B1C78_15400 [Thioalkalivibrio denitrificans]|uniref:Transmembrane protein n=1 Tax=Thioalkalivibrio denitrificans TaxID=108003 RepID=A0A1V3NBQ4_9GAMM|nr:hypothetical protein [Thioalkalivibrio denitrificans]OOG22282.1 hypothetical protein B1C78_15400 [Thioalkalivibrio denitrificans]